VLAISVQHADIGNHLSTSALWTNQVWVARLVNSRQRWRDLRLGLPFERRVLATVLSGAAVPTYIERVFAHLATLSALPHDRRPFPTKSRSKNGYWSAQLKNSTAAIRHAIVFANVLQHSFP
jgi:hypothetical protein